MEGIKNNPFHKENLNKVLEDEVYFLCSNIIDNIVRHVIWKDIISLTLLLKKFHISDNESEKLIWLMTCEDINTIVNNLEDFIFQ